MARSSSNRNLKPLDAESLRRLAIDYVGRYATSTGRLRSYLNRKVRERGWGGDDEPPIDETVARCRELGYLDDASFAATRAASLIRRGYGVRRIDDALRHAGIDENAADAARADVESRALEAALAFARRRRIGPYGEGNADADAMRKDMARMMRAGHSMGIARRVLALPPGQVDQEETD